MLKYFVAGLLICACSASIGLTGGAGRRPSILYDMMISGGEEECTSFYADGSVVEIEVNMVFNSMTEMLASPADMIFTMTTTNMTSLTRECMWYGGYNGVTSDCLKIGSINLKSAADPELNNTYKFIIDTQPYNIYGKLQWTICVGNGWVGSMEPVRYNGIIFVRYNALVSPGADLNMPTVAPTPLPTVSSPPTKLPTRAPTRALTSPTSQPTPSPYFRVASSACGAAVTLDMDLTLRGYEQMCVSIAASGALNTATVNMTFRCNAAGMETPSDAGLLLYNTGSGRGVQIGGYGYVDDAVAGNQTSWPKSWSSLSGSSSNIASVDVSSFGVGARAGYYRVCVVNGYKQAGAVRYSGSIALPGLQVDCTVPSPIPTRQPTLFPTQTEMQFSIIDEDKDRVLIAFQAPHLKGGERGCVSVATSGKLAGAKLDMMLGEVAVTSWASDLLVSMRDSQSCLDIGGRSVDGQFLTCAAYALWPPSMDSSVSGQYIAIVDDAPLDADMVARYEEREVCFTNGYAASEEVRMEGSLELLGVTHAHSPTMAPSVSASPTEAPSYPGGRSTTSSIVSFGQGSATFIAVIVIPILVFIAVLLVYCVYCRRRRGYAYDHGFEEPDDSYPYTPKKAKYELPLPGVFMRWYESGSHIGTELGPVRKSPSPPKGTLELESLESGNEDANDISRWLYMHEDTDDLVFVSPKKIEDSGHNSLQMTGSPMASQSACEEGEDEESDEEEGVGVDVRVRIKAKGSGVGGKKAANSKTCTEVRPPLAPVRGNARDLFESDESDGEEDVSVVSNYKGSKANPDAIWHLTTSSGHDDDEEEITF